ncbi:Stage V sporulation protein AF (SpoVAF) [Lachnospiraceae bacterium TWA4]|nr:Stage V sporulation protein AF (SpoVAF) [Lachnospiraceae bacterium TWA4]
MTNNLNETMNQLNSLIPINQSFDLVCRPITIAGKNACLYMIDGFTDGGLTERILQFLLTKKELPEDAQSFLQELLPNSQASLEKEIPNLVSFILTGLTVLLIDGYSEAFVLDIRNYPARGIEEPEKDRTLRGSRDGFVETIACNTALIRRRIRSPHLVHEMLHAGRNSYTDIVLCYLDNRIDKTLTKIKDRISYLQVDSLTMNQESLAECLFPYKWINPFPKFKYTERPDTAAACILEGNLVILVDNSPAAMILPSSIFDIIEEADDYYFPPITGTYLRFSRFITFIMALILTPLFLLLMQNPGFIPEPLKFIAVKDTVNVPLVWQFLILEFAIDGLKLASLNTPSMLTTPLSIMAALVVGEFSVSSGWFNSEVMLYMAFVVISTYTQNNMELGYALKFMRLILLICTGLFNTWGVILGIVFLILSIGLNKTIAGKSYLYPLIPFSLKNALVRFLRVRIPHRYKE